MNACAKSTKNSLRCRKASAVVRCDFFRFTDGTSMCAHTVFQGRVVKCTCREAILEFRVDRAIEEL